MKRESKRIVLVVLMLWLAAVVSAQDVTETVEVEGELFTTELLNSKNMVIISAKDLETLKIKDMADLFSFFTAVNVSRRGPAETSFDISMRGSNFEQVLVLVDGVPLNNPQTGHFNTDFPFAVDDVERIEILRGGSSTTYGAGAFAGMLNIILKKNSTLRVSVTSGDNKFFAGSLRAGTKIKNLTLGISADKANSSGFHEGREFDQLKLTANAAYSRGNTFAEARVGFLKKDFGARGFYAPFPSTETIESLFYRFRLKHTAGALDFSMTWSRNRHDDFFVLDRSRPVYFQSDSLTTMDVLNGSAAYSGNRFAVSAGFDVKRENMDSSSMGSRKRNRGALFLNLNYFFGPAKRAGMDVGLRGNFLPDGDMELTHYTGLFRRLGNSLLFKAGYGKSFRLPSFTELYYHSPSNKGSETLQPETGHNFEASVSLLKEKYETDVSVFYREQRNLIDWVKYNHSGPWRAVNLEANDMFGIEWTHRFELNRTRVMVGLERLIAVNKHEGFQSKYGLRFPDFSARVNVIQPLYRKMNMVVNYAYKQIYGTDERGHFMNLILNVPVGGLEFSLRMDNVFNTIIEEIPGLQVPGRWAYLSIVLK